MSQVHHVQQIHPLMLHNLPSIVSGLPLISRSPDSPTPELILINLRPLLYLTKKISPKPLVDQWPLTYKQDACNLEQQGMASEYSSLMINNAWSLVT